MMDQLLEAVRDTTDRSDFVPVDLVAELGLAAAIDALNIPSVVRVTVVWPVGDDFWELTVKKEEVRLEDGSWIDAFRWEAEFTIDDEVVDEERGRARWQDVHEAAADAKRVLSAARESRR